MRDASLRERIGTHSAVFHVFSFTFPLSPEKQQLTSPHKDVCVSNSQLQYNISMASWIVSCVVLMPLEIMWFLQFWYRRKYLFVKCRRPKLLFNALVLLWIFEFMRWSMDTLHWGRFAINDGKHFWVNSAFYSCIVQSAANNGFLAITLSRWWLLFFS